MKRFFLLWLCLSTVGMAYSQSIEQVITKNHSLTANNYQAYPEPTWQQSSAPLGYVPFYISTYNRHGSRFLINPKDYTYPQQVLGKADSANVLTPAGKRTLDIVNSMNVMAEKRLGELTPAGARQHRDIARRMYHNFPEVFADSATIDTRSTIVIRCILSMMNECMELQGLNPALRISSDASLHDMPYLNRDNTKLNKLLRLPEAEAVYRDIAVKYVHPQRLMAALFSDSLFVKQHVEPARLMNNLFDIACNMQSHDTDMELYSLFTTRECIDLWSKNNISWYLYAGAAPQTKGWMPYREAELLRNILQTADDFLATGRHGATLRFGHESCLLPLVALLELEHYGKTYTDMDSLAEQWRSFEVFPMASNVQFVFYRKPGSEDVLVKVLLNEKERHMPMHTDVYPYYHWKDVKQYYDGKLRNYDESEYKN
ncbi:hypothetical protein JN06_00073 [Bacteroides zoogleoformans]|uniref:Multiple inositol polyphosphate phosphatase 1 n=1 Tax=Bacteroides zoogleoformans TaxID=28119 RepID=A0ABM6T881_9BACE|nr:histidine-type phosphatase [Bacteroides zoogleoformans]AVM52970.1 histidine acid phosphatase [Bacteroides zoogleoformans]TWJ18486.1 hypothetical protein JN06_00073 [Bacteroides zoogleoformans]